MKSRVVMQLATILRYTSRKEGTRMPYIPMTSSEKSTIVKNRLRNMDIEVHKDCTWLDIQIICHQNGLDITEMLRPQIPDKMMVDKNIETISMPGDSKPKKVDTSTKGKKSIGFSSPEQSSEATDGYTL